MKHDQLQKLLSNRQFAGGPEPQAKPKPIFNPKRKQYVPTRSRKDELFMTKEDYDVLNDQYEKCLDKKVENTLSDLEKNRTRVKILGLIRPEIQDLRIDLHNDLELEKLKKKFDKIYDGMKVDYRY
jgi:hypothetical protein